MRHLGFACAILCLLIAVPPTTRAGQIIYDIQNYPSDQNGHTVTGTISTDGHIGTLHDSDITSWTVTIDTTTFRSTDSTAFASASGDLTATSTAITLPNSLNPFTNENVLTLEAPVAIGSKVTPQDIFWIRITTIPQMNYYTATWPTNTTPPLISDSFTTTNPHMGGTDPWVIAVASVPEPSSAVEAVIGVVCGLAYGWYRHRRDQRRQRPVGPPDATE